MTRRTRRAVADQLGPHRRMQPVGAHQQFPGDRLAGFEIRGDRAAVLVVTGDRTVHAQIDQIVILAGFDQFPVEVCAVDHRIGIAEPFAEILVERHMRDLFRRHGIHEAQLFDIDRLFPRALADTQIIEGMKGIGSKLDTCADFSQFRRLFEDNNVLALFGQSQSCAQSAQPAACNDDWILRHIEFSRFLYVQYYAHNTEHIKPFGDPARFNA